MVKLPNFGTGRQKMSGSLLNRPNRVCKELKRKQANAHYRTLKFRIWRHKWVLEVRVWLGMNVQHQAGNLACLIDTHFCTT